jgi:hypothetical protein
VYRKCWYSSDESTARSSRASASSSASNGIEDIVVALVGAVFERVVHQWAAQVLLALPFGETHLFRRVVDGKPCPLPMRP